MGCISSVRGLLPWVHCVAHCCCCCTHCCCCEYSHQTVCGCCNSPWRLLLLLIGNRQLGDTHVPHSYTHTNTNTFIHSQIHSHRVQLAVFIFSDRRLASPVKKCCEFFSCCRRVSAYLYLYLLYLVSCICICNWVSCVCVYLCSLSWHICIVWQLRGPRQQRDSLMTCVHVSRWICCSFPAALLLLPALANGKSCRQNGIIKMTFLAGKTHKIINRPNALDIWPERGSGLAGSTPATWLDEVASTVLNCFCGKTPAEGVIGPFRATLGTFFFSSARLRSILIRFEVFSEKRTRGEGRREEIE